MEIGLSILRLRFRRGFLWACALSLGFALAACEHEAPLAPNEMIDLSAEWPTATPESQGMDAAQLAEAYAKARQITGLKSLLVVRHGYLVGEEYFAGNHSYNLYHVCSVTKSVMSALIGIAIEKGYINSLQKLSEVLGSNVVQLDEAKGQIRIRHLLTMTGGFQWNDNTEFGTAQQQIVPKDWVAQSTQIQFTLNSSFGVLQRINYGYLWWLSNGQAQAVFLAWGYGGQFVYCIPQLALVVVTTAEWQVSGSEASRQEAAILDLIVNQTVAVR